MSSGIRVTGRDLSVSEQVLTPEALTFIAQLQRTFESRRKDLLRDRVARQDEINQGQMPDFLSETSHVRQQKWTVASAPLALQDRRVEITGPVDRKMMINALNSGAKVFMADLEDSLSPTWENVILGQANLQDAVRRSIEFASPDGREYHLNESTATLVVRPRGWHLHEIHVLVDEEPISASLFDFGLYFFHNARELVERGSGPYFYLPKLQSHREARLWNDVFIYAQEALGIPHGTIRATVLIEHIFGAFEMEEILYELRDHIAGLNAGRWDYIFSMIKTFRNRSDFVLPDRALITTTVPFMRAYTELLVKTCHRRGAYAIGGMAAFIPNRQDPQLTEIALAKVREDKNREAGDGFDGTWVAHPALVPVAMESFDHVLGDRLNQRDRLREDVQISAADLLNTEVPGGEITLEGIRNNISVALQYLNAWLQGTGAASIYNLMEDAATAEISRAQLWQWIRQGVHYDGSETFDRNCYKRIRSEELEKLGGPDQQKYGVTAQLLDELVLSDEFTEFLTIPAYDCLR